MLEDITTLIKTENFWDSLRAHVEPLFVLGKDYLFESSNIKIISISLISLAVVLFLFVLVLLLLKSILLIVHSKPVEQSVRYAVQHDTGARLEKERDDLYEAERSGMDQQNLREAMQDKIKEQTKPLEQNKEPKVKGKKEVQVTLDWQKGKLKELEGERESLSSKAVLYHPEAKDLPQLLGLIMDMIARGVEELKIAQTIRFRNQGKTSEDEVLQLVESIKEFLRLCQEKKFDLLRNNQKIPSEAEALTHMAQGDVSLAMIMLQALIDEKVNKSAAVGIGAKRNALFKEASNLALNFGAISSLEDLNLAVNALELSIELNPQNVRAWNKAADVYYKLGKSEKAIWAYKNLLKMANEEEDMRPIANAAKMLAAYFAETNNLKKAKELVRVAKEYYDRIGINRRLDQSEIDIVDFIEAKQKEEIPNVVKRILER